ncbi:hypothetical protein OROMI_007728 [Orobanche minor]
MKKEDTVKLISAEGFEFVIDKKAAMVSQTIRNMLTSPGGFAETEHGEVTFPEISTTILEKICQYFYWSLQYASPVNPAGLVNCASLYANLGARFQPFSATETQNRVSQSGAAGSWQCYQKSPIPGRTPIWFDRSQSEFVLDPNRPKGRSQTPNRAIQDEMQNFSKNGRKDSDVPGI